MPRSPRSIFTPPILLLPHNIATMTATASPMEAIQGFLSGVGLMTPFFAGGPENHLTWLVQQNEALEREKTDLMTAQNVVIQASEENRRRHVEAEAQLQVRNTEVERVGKALDAAAEEMARTAQHLEAKTDEVERHQETLQALGEELERTQQKLAKEEKQHASAKSARGHAQDKQLKSEEALAATKESLEATTQTLRNLQSKAAPLKPLVCEVV